MKQAARGRTEEEDVEEVEDEEPGDLRTWSAGLVAVVFAVLMLAEA